MYVCQHRYVRHSPVELCARASVYECVCFRIVECCFFWCCFFHWVVNEKQKQNNVHKVAHLLLKSQTFGGKNCAYIIFFRAVYTHLIHNVPVFGYAGGYIVNLTRTSNLDRCPEYVNHWTAMIEEQKKAGKWRLVKKEVYPCHFNDRPGYKHVFQVC